MARILATHPAPASAERQSANPPGLVPLDPAADPARRVAFTVWRGGEW